MQTVAESGILLSIIVPFHNRGQEINELLLTVPDRADLEVLLVDDRSTEEVSLNREFSAARLKVLSTQGQARFAGSARNVGLEAAQGRFVFFCDSDDLLSPEAFVEAMDMLPGFDGDILYALTEAFYSDGSPGNRAAGYNHLVRTLSEMGEADAMIRFHAPWSKFIRRSFVERCGARFDETRVSNDVMFNARLNVAGPARQAFLKAVYRVRQGNPSLTNDVSLENVLQRVEVLHRYNDLLRAHGMERYQVAAFTHIKKIMRSHARSAIGAAAATLFRGQPLFITPFNLRMRLGMRRRKLAARSGAS